MYDLKQVLVRYYDEKLGTDRIIFSLFTAKSFFFPETRGGLITNI